LDLQTEEALSRKVKASLRGGGNVKSISVEIKNAMQKSRNEVRQSRKNMREERADEEEID